MRFYYRREVMQDGTAPKLMPPLLAPSDEGAVGVSRLRERKSCALHRMKNQRTHPKPSPRSAAPLRGSPQCAHWGKGSPELRHEQGRKERAEHRKACHCEEQSDVAIRSPLLCPETYCRLKKKRIPTTSDIGHWSWNDRGFLYVAFSFSHWQLLKTGDPFGATRHFP